MDLYQRLIRNPLNGNLDKRLYLPQRIHAPTSRRGLLMFMKYHFYPHWNNYSLTHSFWKRCVCYAFTCDPIVYITTLSFKYGYMCNEVIYSTYVYTSMLKVLRGHQRSDGLLADYCDGTAYKSHPLFSRDHRSLQIMAYYDDIEVCNPLGSRAKKHKLGMLLRCADN